MTGPTTRRHLSNGSSPVDDRTSGDLPATDSQRRGIVAGKLHLALLSVLIVVVGAAAGYLGSLFMPKQFAARAEISYSLAHAEPNELLREDRRLTTQLVLLRSRVVLAPVASDNRMSPDDLTKQVSAEVVDSSEIIQVEVRDRTSQGAQMLLRGVIDRYLVVANKDWQDPVRAYLESQLAAVQSQLRVPGLPDEDATRLGMREQVIRDILDAVASRGSGESGSPSGPPARVLTEPYAVADQVSPKPLFAAATGAAAALVVAAFVILLVARRRLRS